MIIVTGGAGFIGSNIVSALNGRGKTEILVVDDMSNGRQMHNLSDLNIADYLDKDDFKDRILKDEKFPDIEAIFHEGACSDTTEWDGRYLMRNNFEYSKLLLHWSQKIKAQFLYASSASVYGLGENGFKEQRSCERPINMYAYSKFQFDQYVRSFKGKLTSQVAGFRYFNVYGPREDHKDSMASTIYHFNNQAIEGGCVKLFEGHNGHNNGDQARDFVFVDDCVKVNLWFLDNPTKMGIFNVGTGVARTFNDVASCVLDWNGGGHVDYIEFPQHLKGSYQDYTCADLSALRSIGYKEDFSAIEVGIPSYLGRLGRKSAANSIY
jgi:ADP-L-glycero-D-manno-heptose 6-epimerase